MLKNILKVTASLTILCIVVSGLLALTYAVTLDSIGKQEALAVQEAQKKVLPQASSFEQKQLQSNGTSIKYSEGKTASGETSGYVFQTRSKGYGGDIVIMSGITSDGKIAGVTILSNEETPGLGKKAENSSFTDQYKKSVPQNGFSVVRGGASGNNGPDAVSSASVTPSADATAGKIEIDAISGATVTSKAVTAAVNEAVLAYWLIRNGGGK